MTLNKPFKLSIIPSLERGISTEFETYYTTLEKALAAHDAAARLLIFMADNGLMKDDSNMFSVSRYIETTGEWEDIDVSELEGEQEQVDVDVTDSVFMPEHDAIQDMPLAIVTLADLQGYTVMVHAPSLNLLAVAEANTERLRSTFSDNLYGKRIMVSIAEGSCMLGAIVYERHTKPISPLAKLTCAGSTGTSDDYPDILDVIGDRVFEISVGVSDDWEHEILDGVSVCVTDVIVTKLPEVEGDNI